MKKIFDKYITGLNVGHKLVDKSGAIVSNSDGQIRSFLKLFCVRLL